jgi:1-acyl-sn-glycerol-3-phosphate acyltransferase
MSGLAGVLTRTFFRQVEVEHGERLDSVRPTVVVADHRNGLVDGLLLMAALPRYPRFLGKSTLFRNPLLWPFLQVGGVVPIYRAQDGGSPEGNRRAFARCHRLLAGGGMVAIFPEGISHDLPALQPLRTGAARIALEAAGDGVVDVDTVTVTLVYDDKQRFRSRALVRVGVPVPVQPWLEAYRHDAARAVRALTADLTERLRRDGTEYDSWADAAELAGMAEVMVRPTTVLPGEVTLEDRRLVAEALTEAGLSREGSDALARARAAMTAYQRRLDLLGLTDAQVAAEYGSGRLRWDLARALVKVVVALPFAAAGVAIHAVPYGIVDLASRVPDNVGMRATVKVLGSFLLYAPLYLAIGVVVGSRFGAGWGLLAAAGAPTCGGLAVRVAERIRRVGGAVAGYRAVRAGGPTLAALRSERVAVAEAGRSVVTGTAPPRSLTNR